MSQRLFQIFFLLTALMSGVMMVHAIGSGEISGYGFETNNDARALAGRGVINTFGSGISVPDGQHSAPCYLECQHPFLRSLNQANPSLSNKGDVDTHSTMARQSIAAIPVSGWLSGRLKIWLFNPPGPPYQAHRARTGRQLT